MFVLLLMACVGDFESVDAACKDGVTGEGSVDGPEIEYWRRGNCYRRYVGLSRQRIDPIVQEAVANHVHYLALNFDPSIPDSWGNDMLGLQGEEPGRPGFTGVDDWARFEALIATDLSPSRNGAWWTAGTLNPDTTGEDWSAVADYEMEHFITRQGILQPRASGAGIAVEGGFYYGFDTYAFPADTRTTNPVVWPVDGEVDVPLTTTNWFDTAGFPLGYGETNGYHISVTVGSTSAVGNWFDGDPYRIVVDSASLVGPDGEVDLRIIPPSTPATPGGLLYTVGFIPVDPLEPDATYTFDATLTWTFGTRPAHTTFTTAPG